MNTDQPFHFLFLCTGNSARSVFGEYILRRLGRGRFVTYSAGAMPSGVVNPYTLRVLRDVYKIDASDARSKSWDELAAIPFDFVITVCDKAKESCPVWPGQPIVAHWGSPDPAAFEGTDEEKYKFFQQVAVQMHRRIDIFCNLPLEKLDRLRLAEMTRSVGQKEVLDTDVSHA